jgi:hypothetical protein
MKNFVKDDIEKYLKKCNWNVFINDKILKLHMSIIRTMLKEMDVKYTCSSCKMKNEDGKYFNTTLYIII